MCDSVLYCQDQVYPVFVVHMIVVWYLISLEIRVSSKVVVDSMNASLFFPYFIEYVILDHFLH